MAIRAQLVKPEGPEQDTGKSDKPGLWDSVKGIASNFADAATKNKNMRDDYKHKRMKDRKAADAKSEPAKGAVPTRQASRLGEPSSAIYDDQSEQ
jgi:hypothetical protein